MAGDRSAELIAGIYPNPAQLEHHLAVQRRAGIYLYRDRPAAAANDAVAPPATR
jgi:hypothetical protein